MFISPYLKNCSCLVDFGKITGVLHPCEKAKNDVRMAKLLKIPLQAVIISKKKLLNGVKNYE